MKQFYIFFAISSLIFTNNTLQAQSADFLYDVSTSIGSSGHAGVIFINNQFWISEWASDNIHVLDNTGTFVETFQVAGLTGTRSLSTDGTNVYAATAGLSIYEIDPITKTLTNTISITTTSTASARFCAYDSTLNNGSGGFWIGNFNTDITSVDMTGNQLSVILNATHSISGMYGAAVDEPNGILYIYSQQDPNLDAIRAINLSTGLPSTEFYDFAVNDAIPHGVTGSIAGGLFISDEVIPGQTTAIGLSQASPNDLLFGVNIDNVLSVDDVTKNELNLEVYPNPSHDFIKISGSTTPHNYIIYNILGTKINKGVTSSNSIIDIQNLANGIYLLKLDNGNTLRFIKE